MYKNFENQNNKEENKLKIYLPPDDDSVKGKSTKNYRLQKIFKKIQKPKNITINFFV